MELLQFARGPGLAIALSVFFAGSLWRVLSIFRRPAARDLSVPRNATVWPGALRGIVARMWHHRTFHQRTLAGTVNAYAYHIGLALVVFGFVPHIGFVQRLTGLSWPPLPGWVFAAAAAVTFIGLLYALMIRLTSPVLRLLSGFDDYFSWLVTLLPMLTGMALVTLPLDATYPPEPAQPVPVALHLLSLELLLIWLPFGKLAHAFLVFVSRGMSGAVAASKGTTL